MIAGLEAAEGRLEAVLRLVNHLGPAALGRHGPWVVTTAEHARAVLTDPARFDFPDDVSRRGRPASTGTSPRSPHTITPPLARDQVARGGEVFARELAAGAPRPGAPVDAMTLLRTPVARATTAAVLDDADAGTHARVADLVLDWVDALGPVVARPRPPRRWSAVRRAEDRARRRLESALTQAGAPHPAGTATLLAAGVQVPIAAGAWLLVHLASDPALADGLRERPELARTVAWETLRVTPPTWLTARLTTLPVELGGVLLPAGAVVLVSPLLLGRLQSLAPGPATGASAMTDFDPTRWDQEQARPGAWLPFGAGPHACPGRNLGLALLTDLAAWAAGWRISLVEPVGVDQSRGIFPRPARLGFVPC